VKKTVRAELAILHYLCNPHPQNKENKMNVNQLRERFTKLSIDELVVQLDRFSADEPTVESRIVEAVLAQKISALTKELPFPKEEDAPELDGRTCPPAINSPSTASFESVTPRGDSNSVAPHVEMFGPELKPSPAPRWLSSDAAKPAVLDPNALPVQKIHKDGICAESFIGEIPGTSVVFVNPNRQERRAAVRTPLASEISTKD
jgi:Fe-S-cluster formation regulator IscX/YfhJ